VSAIALHFYDTVYNTGSILLDLLSLEQHCVFLLGIGAIGNLLHARTFYRPHLAVDLPQRSNNACVGRSLGGGRRCSQADAVFTAGMSGRLAVESSSSLALRFRFRVRLLILPFRFKLTFGSVCRWGNIDVQDRSFIRGTSDQTMMLEGFEV
jgi:hypothetical protein